MSIQAGMITIKERQIPVQAPDGLDLEKAVASVPFQDWVRGLDPRFRVSAIRFQSLDCKRDGQVLFVKFKADVTDAEGRWAPDVVFAVGGGVVILPVFVALESSQHYVALVRQARPPIGAYDFAELPAGRLDGSDNFIGKAAEELFEELGMKVKIDDLVDLTERVYGNRFRGVCTSPGASDEFLRIFLCGKILLTKDLDAMRGRIAGKAEEGERTKVEIVPLRDAARHTADAKTLVALQLYHLLGYDDDN